jgi:3'-phosphoadenosine 5'-phosphosulfate sulfotransferase (PAPS reductase)/FAD synthetase
MIDWTENTFAEYLEERNADVAVATRDAGPLLYKMVINYGSFPFPPGQAQQLTCAIFLRGIYMMSRMKQRLFWRDNGTLGGEPCTRKRQPSDDVRLLFQSMADNESRTMLPPTQRSDVDDEDLIDVLFTLWDGIRERRNPKLATRRRDVLSAAATLPSSLSRNLEGTLNEADLGFLLQLIVKLLNTRFLNTMPLSPSDTTGCITEGFSRGLPRWEGVRWDAFHDTVLESLVRQITQLSRVMLLTRT